MRSLELKLKQNLTTGMFNFVVKDPIRTALGGRFGSNGHTTRAHPLVLETFQTYRALDRAVNRCISLINKGALDLARKLLSLPKTRDMPLRMPWPNFCSEQRHRNVLISLKILFWRLCDYRGSYRLPPCGTDFPALWPGQLS